MVRSIFPPNFCGGAGIWSPWMVVVALGAPGVPVTCCARLEVVLTSHVASNATSVIAVRDVLTSCLPFRRYLKRCDRLVRAVDAALARFRPRRHPRHWGLRNTGSRR